MYEGASEVRGGRTSAHNKNARGHLGRGILMRMRMASEDLAGELSKGKSTQVRV